MLNDPERMKPSQQESKNIETHENVHTDSIQDISNKSRKGRPRTVVKIESKTTSSNSNDVSQTLTKNGHGIPDVNIHSVVKLEGADLKRKRGRPSLQQQAVTLNANEEKMVVDERPKRSESKQK